MAPVPMATLYVEGDPEALELVAAALRSAGLGSMAVELMARRPEVAPFPAVPGNWAAYADLAPDLCYADWRDEVLSLVDAQEPATLRAALSLCGSIGDLRRAG